VNDAKKPSECLYASQRHRPHVSGVIVTCRTVRVSSEVPNDQDVSVLLRRWNRKVSHLNLAQVLKAVFSQRLHGSVVEHELRGVDERPHQVFGSAGGVRFFAASSVSFT
jgi:hypothetical protein